MKTQNEHANLRTRTLALLGVACLLAGCLRGMVASAPGDDPDRQAERAQMVEFQLAERGVRDQAVLAAMRRIPRHRFVPEAYAEFAYLDTALPIGHDQTITQPYLVAFMTEALELHGSEKVLEVGTGSGYQAAVLAAIAREVFTIEILEPLATRAEATLAALGYRNIRVRVGDGYGGWPEEAPFDAILVTAATDHVPQPLLDQLAVGGRLLLPLGRADQTLTLIRRRVEGYEYTTLIPVAFVPLTRKGAPD